MLWAIASSFLLCVDADGCSFYVSPAVSVFDVRHMARVNAELICNMFLGE